jgi:aspartate racemase
MRKIGLIGGMSYISTLEYYRIINEEYAKLRGEHHSAELVLTSVDFSKVVSAMHQSQWKVIENILIDHIQLLERAKVDFAIICCNSAHKVLPNIQPKINLPIIHILEPIGYVLKEKNVKKIAVIGTEFVMKDTFYTDYIYKNFNIESIVPSIKDQETIHTIIYQELCRGSG